MTTETPHGKFLTALLAEEFPPTLQLRGAEVGVYKGETSHMLLSRFPALNLYAVDCWEPSPFKLGRNQFSAMAQQQNRPEVFAAWEREARTNTAFAGERCQVLKGDFRKMAAKIPSQSLDFVFLDASHSYQDTMEQILWYLPKVRIGGLVTGHDYGYPAKGYEVVAEAVNAAATFLGAELHVDHGSYVWFWKKQICKGCL